METTDAAREIIESLYTQLEVMRDQLEGARAREAFLQHLLEADRSADRETRLLALLEADRRELRELRPSHHIALPHEAAARPVPPIGASRPPSAELHGRIVEVLAASSPEGLTARELESAVGSPTPLKHVLRHLARRGRLVRRGDGKFGVGDAV
jgi:hypothetical protein